MKRIFIFSLLFLCLITNNLYGEEGLYYKNIYVVDTVDIENPIIIQHNKFHIPLFICSYNNFLDILKDKEFYNRSDVYILGYGDFVGVIGIEAISILKNKECQYEKAYKVSKYNIFKIKKCSKFLLTLVTVEKTNDMFSNYLDDCIDNSCKKEKRFFIKMKHPYNFYNRIVYPLCE